MPVGISAPTPPRWCLVPHVKVVSERSVFVVMQPDPVLLLVHGQIHAEPQSTGAGCTPPTRHRDGACGYIADRRGPQSRSSTGDGVRVDAPGPALADTTGPFSAPWTANVAPSQAEGLAGASHCRPSRQQGAHADALALPAVDAAGGGRTGPGPLPGRAVAVGRAQVPAAVGIPAAGTGSAASAAATCHDVRRGAGGGHTGARRHLGAASSRQAAG